MKWQYHFLAQYCNRAAEYQHWGEPYIAGLYRGHAVDLLWTIGEYL